MSKSLGFLQPRETQRILKARGARRMFRLVRYGLPVVAVGLIGVLILWPMIDPKAVKTAVMQAIPDIVVQNPHYSGLDSKNQPFTLSAATATRPSGTANLYDLVKPAGELTLQNGTWISGKALYGRYDQDAHKLWLGGDVELFHDHGYQFTTNEAQVDIDNNLAWGEKPVVIQGGFGEIHGQGFRLLEDGNVMIVKGPARAILHLRDGKASDKPNQAP